MIVNATIVIIAITCLVSIYGFSNAGFISAFSHHPSSEASDKQYYRLLTSGFLHADPFHLFVNMYVLYGFGSYVEERFQAIHGMTTGVVLYVVFYLLMIVLANIPTFNKYKDYFGFSSIGASGTTSAILFSYVLFEPLSMLGLYFVIPIPAILFALLYLWYSTWAGRKGGDMIDHEAHYWGAVAGFLFTLLLKPSLFLEFISKIFSIFS